VSEQRKSSRVSTQVKTVRRPSSEIFMGSFICLSRRGLFECTNIYIIPSYEFYSETQIMRCCSTICKKESANCSEQKSRVQVNQGCQILEHALSDTWDTEVYTMKKFNSRLNIMRVGYKESGSEG